MRTSIFIVFFFISVISWGLENCIGTYDTGVKGIAYRCFNGSKVSAHTFTTAPDRLSFYDDQIRFLHHMTSQGYRLVAKDSWLDQVPGSINFGRSQHFFYFEKP